jgi:hypothetical protein
MRTKATFLAGFATGYVLGSRAGRARYEQIRRSAKAVAASPAVQRIATSVQHQAGDALSAARDKATGAVSERLHDRRPAWRGSGSGSDPTPAAGEASWAAGSNGHVGA